MPRRSLGEHRHLRDDVGAGLEVAECLSFLAASLVAAADADDAAVLHEQPVRARLREDDVPPPLPARRDSATSGRSRRSSCRGCGASAAAGCAGRAAGEQVDALARDLAVGRDAVQQLGTALEEPPCRPRVHDRAREQVRAGLLPLVDERDGHFAEALCGRGIVLEQLAEADRAGEAGRAAADDQDADLDPLVGRVGRRRDDLGARERRWVVGGADLARHASSCGRARARRASGDLVQIADDAEVGEVEDRRVRVLVDRDDRAGVLHADLVLDRAGDPERDVELRRDRLPGLADLRRIRVPPCVDDRARRRDGAAERCRQVLGQLEAVRATEPAPACDDDVGVLDRRPARLLVRTLDHRGGSREVLGRRRRPLTSAVPPDSTGSNAPGAHQRDPGSARPPDVDEHGVPERRALPDERPSSRRKSVTSQFRPASSRAESPAATSAASTEAPKRTVSASVAATTASSASTRGCGRGASNAGLVDDVDGGRAVGSGRAATSATPLPTTTPATSPPSEAAFASTPSAPFWMAPSWCSRKTSVVTAASSPRASRPAARRPSRRPRS